MMNNLSRVLGAFALQTTMLLTALSIHSPRSLVAAGGCNDDTDYRYYGDWWKNCEWIAANGRCNRWDKDTGYNVGSYYCPDSCDECDDHPAPSPTRTPVYKPTSPPQSGCYDDPDYRWYGDIDQDCAWIADNDRCDRVKNGHNVGEEYCPKSCGYCHPSPTPAPVPKPTPTPVRQPTRAPVQQCHDDTDYRYYDDWWKDCEWIADHNRCDRYDPDTNKHVGSTYCPKSCDECDYPNPVPKPTSAPVKTPTKPTCQDYVETEKYCYSTARADTIAVFFENCEAAGKDWIGIYSVNAASDTTALVYAYTCGTMTCSTPYDDGTVFFDYNEWKGAMKSGRHYIVYLFEDDSTTVKATSSTFVVKDYC